MLYGFIQGVPGGLQQVFNAYFISAAVLFVLNYWFHIKASGHACSSTGPAVFCMYFLGAWYILPCLAVLAASFWASLRTKRHTAAELAAGAAVAAAAFGISCLLKSL